MKWKSKESAEESKPRLDHLVTLSCEQERKDRIGPSVSPLVPSFSLLNQQLKHRGRPCAAEMQKLKNRQESYDESITRHYDAFMHPNPRSVCVGTRMHLRLRTTIVAPDAKP